MLAGEFCYFPGGGGGGVHTSIPKETYNTGVYVWGSGPKSPPRSGLDTGDFVLRCRCIGLSDDLSGILGVIQKLAMALSAIIGCTFLNILT